MTKEYNKLDKTFNITPEVVEEETTVVEREKPDRLRRMILKKIMSIQEVIFIV